MDINSTNKFENQNEASQLLPSSYIKNEMLILVFHVTLINRVSHKNNVAPPNPYF